MAQESFTPAQMEKLVSYASQQLGTTPEKLKEAFAQGGLSGISSALNAEEAAKAQAFLQDREKVTQLMNNPQVQKFLAQLLGEQ